jgi:hypothetical protein
MGREVRNGTATDKDESDLQALYITTILNVLICSYFVINMFSLR